MREFLVVGAGAMGGVYAACLARVGRVCVLDASPEHIAAIRTEGLRLSGATRVHARPEAFADPREIGRRAFDAVLLMVKSGATRAAALGLQDVLAGAPLLVTFQNGMGNVEILRECLPFEIAHGVTFEAGRQTGPGQIEHFIHGEDAWLGPAGGRLDTVQAFGEALTRGGLPTRVVPDPRGAIWAKFVFNCVMNPVGALVGGENRARFEVPEMGALIDRLFAEGEAVAAAAGVTLAYDPMHLVKRIRAGTAPLTRHAGSMATDIAAGRPTELEQITGWLVGTAARLGVDVPAMETVYRLAKGLEYAALLRARSDL